MASPILAMLTQVAKPAIRRGQSAMRRAASRAKATRAATLADVKYTRTGKIARGSRKLYNTLMNAKYGKPIGRHGLTWAQLADKGYGGGAPGYVGDADAEDDGE